MSQKTNIYSDEWCELIFTEKNHEYGAYAIRKQSWKRQLWATLLAVIFFTVAVSSPVIIKSIIPGDRPINSGVITITDVDLVHPKKVVDDIIIPEEQLTKSSLKFVAFVITPDELVNEDEVILSQDVLNQSRLAISNVTYVGNSEDYGNVVIDLDQPNLIGDKVEPPPYTFVEQMPEFSGGTEELQKYIVANTHYPVMAREEGTTGVVFVTFVINKNGSIQDVKLLRGIGNGCDEEAIRVVKSMPNWKPGKQNGTTVNVQLNLPVNFKLKE